MSERQTRTKSDPSQNGDAPGEDHAGDFGAWLDDLLDQVAGFGVTVEGLQAAGLSLRVSGEDDWPEPRPLPGSAPVPPWPGGLGDVADKIVTAVAAATATYPDIAGMCALAVASSLLASSVVVQGGPDWFEPLILQGIVVAASGEGKSPALEQISKPLDGIEAAWAKATEPEIAAAESKRRIKDSTLKRIERAKDPDYAEAERLARDLAQTPVPVTPRLYVNESTPEGFLKEMAAQGGRIAVFSEEASTFFENASRYSQNGKANWGVYLAGADGRRYRSSRVSRETYDIEHCCLPYVLLGQPVVLESLGRDRHAAGIGLFNRPLWSLPPSKVGYRPNDRPAISQALSRSWHQLVQRLAGQGLGITINDDGTVVPPPEPTPDGFTEEEREDESGRRLKRPRKPEPPRHEGRFVLTLSPEAQELFDSYREKHEPRLAPNSGDLAHIAEWGSKLPGRILGLTGAAHALRAGQVAGEIDSTTMQSALDLGDYFIGHALVVFSRMGTGSRVEDAGRILDWLRYLDQPVVTTRQICRSKDWPSERVRAAMETLAEYEYIRRLPVVQGTPGRPPEAWQLNPKWLAK